MAVRNLSDNLAISGNAESYVQGVSGLPGHHTFGVYQSTFAEPIESVIMSYGKSVSFAMRAGEDSISVSRKSRLVGLIPLLVLWRDRACVT